MKLKKLNLKVLLALMVAVALLGAGGYFVYEMQTRRNARKLLAQADYAQKQKNVSREATILDRYLRYRPEDTNALARLGLIQADQAKAAQGASDQASQAALLVLEQVLGRNDAREDVREDVRRRAIDLSLRLRRFPNAKAHIDALTTKHPEDGELEAASGRCAEANEDFKGAIDLYDKAILHDPTLIDTYVRLSRLRRDESEVLKQTNAVAAAELAAKADAVMDSLVANNGKSFEAYLYRALYRLELGLDGAAEDITAAEKLKPDSAMVVLVAARVAEKRSDWDGARQALRRGLEKNPKDSRLYFTLADVETRAGKLPEAEACLIRGVQVLPEDGNLKWQLAETRLDRITREGGDEKRLKQINDQITELSRLNYPKERIGYLQAHARYARKEWRKAAGGVIAEEPGFEAIAPLLDRFPPLVRRVQVMLAECYARLGEADQLFETYRKMSIADPTSREIRHRLASSLEALGRYDEAIEQYRLATDKSDESKLAIETNLAIARLLIRRNLSAPAARRNWDEVASLLDDVGRRAPDDPRLPIHRAEMLVSGDHIDEARALLEKARDAHPDRAELWTALIVLAERRGKGEDLTPLLDAAEKSLGDRVEIRLARARNLATRGGPDVATKLQALRGSLDKFSTEERTRLIRGLAESLARSGDAASALALWTDHADRRPPDLNGQLLSFDLALRSGNVPAQDRALKQIKALEGKVDSFWLYCQARRTIAKATQGDPSALNPGLDEARENLDVVAGRRKDWDKVPLSLAEIDLLQGKTDLAIKHSIDAINLGERDPGVIRRTLRLLADNKRFEEANDLLERLQDQSAISGEVPRLASELQYQNRDYESALKTAEKTVESGSTDYRDHLWLGQMRWIVGRRADAEAPMRKAVELAGNDLAPVVPLVQYLVASGKKAEAERAIAEAEKKTSAKGSRMILARCYEAINQTGRATELHQQALKETPDDASVQRDFISFLIRVGRSKEAEPYLDGLIKREGKSPEDAEWASRVLAMLLASASDPGRAQRALELVGLEGVKDGGKEPLASVPIARLRPQARVLAIQSTKGKSREAIRLLEEVVRREPGATEERSALARLYEIEGDWAKADAQMRLMVDNNSSVPAYRIRYILALLRNKRAGETGPLLDQLEKLQPDTPLVQQLRAMALSEQGKGDEAVKLLQAFAEKHAEQAGFAAQVLELIGRAPAAEAVLRRQVAQKKATEPQSVLVLAEYLGRQGRTRDALDLCEAAWKTCPPGTVADVCCSILLAADPDDTQVRRVEGWLKAQLARQPSVIQLQIAMAMLKTVQGRFPEAEDLYRRAIEKDPNNVVALNNLAWMIAIKQEGKGAEALQLLERAIVVVGPRGPLLDTRAVIHMRMGHSDLALTDLEAAIADNPAAPMYFHLAQAFLMANRRDDAQAALQDGQRLGLKPNSLDPLERPAYTEVVAALARN